MTTAPEYTLGLAAWGEKLESSPQIHNEQSQRLRLIKAASSDSLDGIRKSDDKVAKDDSFQETPEELEEAECKVEASENNTEESDLKTSLPEEPTEEEKTNPDPPDTETALFNPDSGSIPENPSESAERDHPAEKQENLQLKGNAANTAGVVPQSKVIKANPGSSQKHAVRKEGDRSEKLSLAAERRRRGVAARMGSVATKADQRVTKIADTGSTVQTGRESKRKPQVASRTGPNNSREAQQTVVTKKTHFVASKPPRTTEARVPRVLMGRNHRKGELQEKAGEKGPSSKAPKSSFKQATTASTNAEVTRKQEQKVNTVLSNTTFIPKLDPSNAEPISSIHKPDSFLTLANRNAEPKPPNGVLHNSKPKTRPEPKAHESMEDAEQTLKAQALLNTAVLRKLARVEDNPAAVAQAQAVDLNSSAGAKSLNAFTQAHKQSLTVPVTGMGPATAQQETDFGESHNGSGRRESIRQSVDSSSRKSVDYRLQAAQAVVTLGAPEEKPKSLQMHDDSLLRAAIPALPVPLAVLCLLLNIVIPGLGTILSGMSVMCCSKSRLPSKGDTMATIVCVNLCVGAAQLGTITFFLVGWFWSLAWGIKMIILAVEHRAEQRQQREKELQTMALRAFGSPGNLRRSLLPPA